MDYLTLIVAIIVIIGAANWGAVGAFNVDLVHLATPGYPMIEQGIKIVVGLAAVYYAYLLYIWSTSKKNEKPSA